MLHRRQFLEGTAMALAAIGLPRTARAADTKIIDAQVHCYERNRPERPWAGVLVGPDEMTGDQMVAAMDAVGVDGAVLVSPFTMYQYDPSYVLEVEAKHADRFCLVKPVNPSDPAVADSIADWKTKKGTVGVRILLRPDISKDPADPGINRVLAAAAKHSLAVNLAWSALAAWTKSHKWRPVTPTRRLLSIISAWCSHRSHPPLSSHGRIYRSFWRSRHIPMSWSRSPGLARWRMSRFPTKISGSRSAAYSARLRWTGVCGVQTGRAPSNC
jgi:hypothetical protein